MMRKKMWSLFLIAGAACLAAGCGSGGSVTADRTVNNTTGVEDVLQAGVQAADAGNDEAADAIAEAELTEGETTDASQLIAENADPNVDIDLTALSSTMVYSEVYDMMNTPETYVGKKIKMDGLYSFYHDDTSGNNYFACIIEDATACCAQGIEFELTDNYIYPDDYPEEGGRVAVIGVFDTYEESGYQYCTLRDASLAE